VIIPKNVLEWKILRHIISTRLPMSVYKLAKDLGESRKDVGAAVDSLMASNFLAKHPSKPAVIAKRNAKQIGSYVSQLVMGYPVEQRWMEG